VSGNGDTGGLAGDERDSGDEGDDDDDDVDDDDVDEKEADEDEDGGSDDADMDVDASVQVTTVRVVTVTVPRRGQRSSGSEDNEPEKSLSSSASESPDPSGHPWTRSTTTPKEQPAIFDNGGWRLTRVPARTRRPRQIASTRCARPARPKVPCASWGEASTRTWIAVRGTAVRGTAAPPPPPVGGSLTWLPFFLVRLPMEKKKKNEKKIRKKNLRGIYMIFSMMTYTPKKLARITSWKFRATGLAI
jgi:hypothetical protein